MTAEAEIVVTEYLKAVMSNDSSYNHVVNRSEKDDEYFNMSKLERDKKYEENVANLRRIAKKFSMDIDLSGL